MLRGNESLTLGGIYAEIARGEMGIALRICNTRASSSSSDVPPFSQVIRNHNSMPTMAAVSPSPGCTQGSNTKPTRRGGNGAGALGLWRLLGRAVRESGKTRDAMKGLVPAQRPG